MRRLALLAAALLAPSLVQAQGIESQPLAPPVEAPAQDDASDTPTIEFKRAPFSSSGPQQPERIAPVETETRPGAQVRLLDKMTGATRVETLRAGIDTPLDRLMVRVERCQTPEDNATTGTRAFLQVRDTARPGDGAVFSGWMFADSPALSAMDHPRYDVWLIACITASGAVGSGSE